MQTSHGFSECFEEHELEGGQRVQKVQLLSRVKTLVREWLAEMLHHSAYLGWVAEHFESGPRNLAGMFLHNSEHLNFG